MFRHLVTFYGPSPFARDPIVVTGIDLPMEDRVEIERLQRNCHCFRDTFPDWFSVPLSSNHPVLIGPDSSIPSGLHCTEILLQHQPPFNVLYPCGERKIIVVSGNKPDSAGIVRRVA
jgi:hypothetical protein